MTDDAIAHFMTPATHTIGLHRSADAAYELMRRFRVHELLVLDGAEPVGLVSQRDVALIDGFDGVDPSEVAVESLMSADVFPVQETTPLRDVTRKMAREHFGCAVVQRGTEVVGVFTETDALRALERLLSTH